MFIVKNMSMRHCKIHEVEMICANAKRHKHHVFGQSRFSLDTRLKSQVLYKIVISISRALKLCII